MSANLKSDEPSQVELNLLGMLWDMIPLKDQLRSPIVVPALAETIMATVEFKGQKLHALEREAELDFTVKFVVREVSASG